MPINEQAFFVLVHPHYPENVGACARAMKTMGFTALVLVKPGRLAVPEHEMARKMAVKAGDVLGSARIVATLAQALTESDTAFSTTSRRGISGVLTARTAALEAITLASQRQRLAFVFGNEKTGLSEEDRAASRICLRIPMAADQPSINLAQAVQLVAYELFVAGLLARGGGLEQ